MTYQSKDYLNYLKKMKDFKQLDWVKNHLQLMKKPNFWTILEYGEDKGSQDRSAHETRSSRMIRWLMDANESHNLGNAFAHKLIQLIGGDYAFYPDKNKAIKSTAEDMDIDVFYKDLSQNMCLAIEVKQFAKEGKSTGFKSQLDKYETLVEKRLKKSDQKIHPYYIYLTPLKEDPSNKNWHAVSYQELIAIIDQVYEEQIAGSTDIYKEDTKKIISDFRDDLQRTIDYLEKDNNYINKTLTDEEKKLTLALAEKIEHGTDSELLDKLMETGQDDDLEVQDLILIVKEYIYAQNHSPNTGVRILIRKIYNYLSEEKTLDLDLNTEYTVKETSTRFKQELNDTYDLDLGKIELTRGKGQGMFIYHKNNTHRIYLSGDTYGTFPNDGVQLLEIANKNYKYTSKLIAKKEFLVNDELVSENKVQDKTGKAIAIEQLMENRIMKVLKEFNDMLGGHQIV